MYSVQKITESRGLGQQKRPTFISTQFGRYEGKELVVICDLPMSWNRGWDLRAKTTCRGKKTRSWLLLLSERGNMCYRGCGLPASFLHKLVSPSMGATDCSMATPGPMLSFCKDLTSLDYHHNIHQLSYMQTTPHPPPTNPPPSNSVSLHPFPTPSPISPAGSSLSDTHSICLIIAPPVVLQWPSSHTRSSVGLPDCSPTRQHSRWHYQPFTVKFNILRHWKIIENTKKKMIVYVKKKNVRKCRRNISLVIQKVFGIYYVPISD